MCMPNLFWWFCTIILGGIGIFCVYKIVVSLPKSSLFKKIGELFLKIKTIYFYSLTHYKLHWGFSLTHPSGNYGALIIWKYCPSNGTHYHNTFKICQIYFDEANTDFFIQNKTWHNFLWEKKRKVWIWMQQMRIYTSKMLIFERNYYQQVLL